MYVIVTDNLFGWRSELHYLIWQPGCWDDDGWTWTTKENVNIHESYNQGPTRYAFATIEDAWRQVRNLNLRTGFVIKWDGA